MKQDNLINLKDRTLKERTEIAIKGNKASITARRIKKYFKLKEKHKRAEEELNKALEEYINKYVYYCKDLNDIILTLRKYEYRHYKSLRNKVIRTEEEISRTARQLIEEIKIIK